MLWKITKRTVMKLFATEEVHEGHDGFDEAAIHSWLRRGSDDRHFNRINKVVRGLVRRGFVVRLEDDKKQEFFAATPKGLSWIQSK